MSPKLSLNTTAARGCAAKSGTGSTVRIVISVERPDGAAFSPPRFATGISRFGFGIGAGGEFKRKPNTSS